MIINTMFTIYLLTNIIGLGALITLAAVVYR